MIRRFNNKSIIIALFFYILITGQALSIPSSKTTITQENYTYKLTQSNSMLQFWTTPPSERVFKDDDLPSETDSQVKVYVAKNEFEPFQIIARPDQSSTVAVSIGDFGSDISCEIYQVKYVNITKATDNLGKTGDYPDPLWPIQNNESVQITGDENTAFWFSVYVPKNAPAGEYTANVKIGNINIPINLHVFNFTIPDELHVKSQMNFSHETILNKYSVSGTGDDYWMYVNKIKQFFMDHRLTPKSALWSGGLTCCGGRSYIDYDCNTGIISDSDGIWGFEDPAEKYLDGTAFKNGIGYPSFMAAGPQNNDASADQRPSTFCNETISAADWYTADNPNTAYNQKWFSYMTDLQTYLTTTGYLDKAYYYIANEPQDQIDYDAVAWYSQELKKAAPNFKLMVSEEARPEIYNHSVFTGSKIDIWLPVLNNYNPEIAHEREKNHNEETWIYFLHGTRPPFFNPITLDHPGIESKLTGWFLWKYRIKGIAYYSLNSWSKNPWTDPMQDNHNGDLFMFYPPSELNENIAYGSNNHRLVPSIRFELMRDSLEDYEYLYVLNNENQPEVDLVNSADTQADKIISGLTSYTRNSEFMYNLRRLIGLKNGNEINEIPDIEPPSSHPRTQGEPGNYYINFQDPTGEPSADPLTVDSKEYMKIGWNEYDENLGYGWYGDLAHVKYKYLDDGPNVLQRSIVYDDWGRQKSFEFDLPNGIYNVSVSVGWYDKWSNSPYSHHKIEIEGVSFIDDEQTINPDKPYIVRTKEVVIEDNKLTMQMGIFNKYTMLNYLDIEAQEPPSISDFYYNSFAAGSWISVPNTLSMTALGAKGPYTFTVSDNNTSLGNIILSGTSSNQSLVSNASIEFLNSAGVCRLTFTTFGRPGPVTITVMATDADGLTATKALAFNILEETASYVELVSFTARPNESGTITLNWITATEIDTAGFKILRSKAECGQYTYITDKIIASKSTFGASYAYTDTAITFGTSYFYKLEELENDGTSEQHDLTTEKKEIRLLSILTNLDLNQDGSFSLGDVIYLLQVFVGIR
ncbi:hypothetical protein GMMP13_1190006 [Candidatus Magnetomoraceae bacterium gMMP-13]